jgi:hypothetical protein
LWAIRIGHDTVPAPGFGIGFSMVSGGRRTNMWSRRRRRRRRSKRMVGCYEPGIWGGLSMRQVPIYSVQYKCYKTWERDVEEWESGDWAVSGGQTKKKNIVV